LGGEPYEIELVGVEIANIDRMVNIAELYRKNPYKKIETPIDVDKTID
jgi:hypothetical protein